MMCVWKGTSIMAVNLYVVLQWTTKKFERWRRRRLTGEKARGVKEGN